MKKLFFLFACALIVSSANARAQSTDDACSPHGVNLIDGLDKKDPKLWSELQAEAAEMPIIRVSSGKSRKTASNRLICSGPSI